ncbi:MAG TPA: hypothetical protein VGZ25_11110 [Gemmataceae bacterium]|nr:hypothetical protein [Gemmataceae bacterium]
MAQDRLETIDPVVGEEIRPALGKLLGMLLFCLAMMIGGALIAYSWWFEVELFAGRAFSTKAGIFGLLAIPIGALLALVALALLASAKKLVIGADCVQLHSKGKVAVHIPYANVAETYASGTGGAGVVGMRLRDRQDGATFVPSWTKDRYEVQVMSYRKPLQEIHQLLKQQLTEYRARAR